MRALRWVRWCVAAMLIASPAMALAQSGQGDPALSGGAAAVIAPNMPAQVTTSPAGVEVADVGQNSASIKVGRVAVGSTGAEQAGVDAAGVGAPGVGAPGAYAPGANASSAGQSDADSLVSPEGEIRRRTAPAGASSSVESSSGVTSSLRVIMSLALVIAVILALRWGGVKLLGFAGAVKPNKAVSLLSRTAIAPRQHVLLLLVGRRVVVVGDSGGRMNALCEISDAQEVAELVGSVRGGATSVSASAGDSPAGFGAAFGRAADDFDADGHAGIDDHPVDLSRDKMRNETRADVSALLAKIQNLSQRFGRAG